MEQRFRDIQKLVKEAGLENPSPSFLSNVMNQVETSVSKDTIVYKPLISKKGWIIVLLTVSVLIGALFLLYNGESVFNKVNFPFDYFIKFENPLSGINFTKTTTYAIVFLALLFFVQIGFLKKRIDKNFAV
ncbi:hypothetical protein M0D21_10565 [Aquimarina sp. D1M17]|uniref:hypothetical protein n=1 Tax=Aquimarina acroporae TaxID=2937283 RepID=UPI0020C10C62|nr:hypothetical protein [Aquimarina acroporae]MCK8522012.1 hypothetical protein [Aquimarina acroporae]